jgi:hypothetical protein
MLIEEGEFVVVILRELGFEGVLFAQESIVWEGVEFKLGIRKFNLGELSH